MGKFNSLNHCEFIGRLGKDAEVRYTPSGQAVANFNIAVDRKDSDNGERPPTWVRCALWGEQATAAYSPHLTKGRLVYVAGRIDQSAYIGKDDGAAKGQLELTVQTIQLLGGSNAHGDEPAPAAEEDIPF